MLDYLKNSLGTDITEEDYVIPKNMPAYLKFAYKYRLFRAYGAEFLIVETEDFSLADYKNHYLKIKELTGLNVAVALKIITPYQKKQLIANHFSFIVVGSQIFLPFLAVCLCEKYESTVNSEQFSPSEQLIFLYFLYHDEKLTATELSKKLGYTVMTVNRAYRGLAGRGLFHFEAEGRKKYLIANYSAGEILTKAKAYLINPVIFRGRSNSKPTDALISGVYALSAKTMLSADENDLCYALTKNNIISCDDETGISTECWSYNPYLLSDDNYVDDISLILSLTENSDERIRIAVDEIKEKYGW